MKKSYLFCLITPVLLSFHAIGQSFPGLTERDPSAVTITCPQDTIIYNDFGECGAWVDVSPATATGSEPIDSIWNNYTGQYSAYAFYNLGITEITWYAVDILGEMDSCTMMVDVWDVEPPMLACPFDIVQANDPGMCGAYVSVPPGFVSDNCSIATFYNDYTGTADASGYYPLGTTTVTFIAIDYPNGNSTTCYFSVTVEDYEAPTITCPANITVNNDTGQCSATVYAPSPVFADNCGFPFTLSWTLTGATAGSSPDTGINYVGEKSFNVGVTTLTYSITDGSGNTATCSYTITVLDDEPPEIICPPDITQPTDSASCMAYVQVSYPLVFDNCMIDSIWNGYTMTITADAIYHVGTTSVIWYGVDGSGNMSTCSMTVTVIDTAQIRIICPSDAIMEVPSGTSSEFVTVEQPLIMGNCGVALYYNNYNFTPNASDTYPLGITQVWWYALDSLGVVADSCAISITVRESDSGIPEEDQNGIQLGVYPNPFSGATTFSINLKEPTQVNLLVMDSFGRIVATVANESLGKGDHHITWNAEGLPSGIYFYHLTTGSQSSSGKMVVVR